MKIQMQWLALVLGFVSAVAVSIGCGVPDMISGPPQYPQKVPEPARLLLSDEVLAIGYPDKALASVIGQDHVFAFLGKKQTYIFDIGGEEMDRVSHLATIDPKYLRIEPAYLDNTQYSFMDGNRVWGAMYIIYAVKEALPEQDETGLTNAGFQHIHPSVHLFDPENPIGYFKVLYISGVIVPAINFTEEQLAGFPKPRSLAFYAPGSKGAPTPVTDVEKTISGIPAVAAKGTIDKAAFGMPAVTITANPAAHQ